MNITPEIVSNLLETLVSPNFDGLIMNYKVTTKYNDNKVVVLVDVILNGNQVKSFNQKKYLEYEENIYFNEYENVTLDIERSIRKTLKYLSPSFVMVYFTYHY